MLWRNTGLPFHPPSPGIATVESTLLYPALAFLEATNVQVGRGTDMAFRWFGAPWLDGQSMATAIAGRGIPGLAVQAANLGTTGDDRCPGVSLEVWDPDAFRPVSMGLRLLTLLSALDPDGFRWNHYPTAANPTGRDHLVHLLGRRDIAYAIMDRPMDIDEDDIGAWALAPEWAERARPHLLYAPIGRT